MSRVSSRLVLTAIAATVEWIGRGGQYAAVGERIEPSRIALLTADIGGDRRQRITPRRLGDELGVDHVGHLPCDGATLDLLCRGASFAHRSMRRSKLAPALHAVAGRLSVDSGSKVRS